MKNNQIARVLYAIATLTEIDGGNAFRAAAYARAARTIERHPEDVADLIRAGEAARLDGVGKSLAGDLQILIEEGSTPTYDKLKAKLPPKILELTAIQGMGPKKIRALHEALGIGSLEELGAAIEQGQLKGLKGFGAKTIANFEAELKRIAAQSGRIPLPRALEVAAEILQMLRGLESVERAELAGSARRGRDMVRDLDFVVASSSPLLVGNAFASMPHVEAILAQGETKTSVRLVGGLSADLRVVAAEVFGSAWHHFTGSKEHHVQLRARARTMGLKISEYGVFRTTDGSEQRVAGADEASIYKALGLAYVPPELREDSGEVAAADSGTLPSLVEVEHVRGDLHMHTTASDGRFSIEDMATAAAELGYAYIAITDHSKSQVIANGLDEARLQRHMQDIQAVDKGKDDIRVFTGIEVDILADGSLDLPLELLSRLDVVVASLHGGFKLDKDTMTKRICTALSSGVVHIFGHPTARLLARRPKVEFDFEEVIETCLEHRVALEINGSSGRLDLDDVMARHAARRGVKLVVNTDAHSTKGLLAMKMGVQVARRAWLEPQQLLNTMPLGELEEWLRRECYCPGQRK